MTSILLKVCIPLQGLPPNYLAKNEEHIRAAEQEPEKQSIEDIDCLLLEAGLQLQTCQEENIDGQNIKADDDYRAPIIEW